MGIVLVDGANEKGLFILRDGNPVQIVSLSAREYMAAVSPFGSPSGGREARLQAPHRRLSAELQEVRLWLEARFLRAIESATARDIEAFHIEQHHALSTLHRIDSSGAHPLGRSATRRAWCGEKATTSGGSRCRSTWHAFRATAA